MISTAKGFVRSYASGLDSLSFKPSRRNLIYASVVLWLVFLNIYLLARNKGSVSEYSIYQSVGLSSGEIDGSQNVIKPDLPNQEPFDPRANINVTVLMEHLNIADFRKLDSHSTVYDKILQQYSLSDVLTQLSFQDRCDLYFNTLYSMDSNWWLNPHEDLKLAHRHQFRYEDFIRSIKPEVRKALADQKGVKPSEVKEDKEFQDRLKLEFAVFWGKTLETEQKATDIITHLRTFNKCYITGDNVQQNNKVNRFLKDEARVIKEHITTSPAAKIKLSDNLVKSHTFDSCGDIENRVYRWLSRLYPSYERWTGERFFKPPNMKKYVKRPDLMKPTNARYSSITKKTIKSRFTGNKACFWNEFKNRLNGKGIVLSIGDQHVDDTVKLIHLMRALNNEYPIQIVSYEELRKESKRAIVNAAQNKLIDLPESFQKVKHHFPKTYFNAKDGGLPKQEVWFVNTHNVIHEGYRGKFNRFSNKFLAAQFNSFSEFMLIDADTVLVQNPEVFFNLKNYASKGAYFFKDRTAAQFRPTSDGYFFQKVSPSIVDNLMFDIPIITSHTTSREFFDGMGHYMESGLVMINRDIHFNSILMMIHLNFLPLVNQRVYGDKEVFWLGFAVNGDEDYHFNKYNAAAIGVETPSSERLLSDGSIPQSREICSAHPGHINGEDDKSLVWFNSGFKFCGQNDMVDYETEAIIGQRFKSLTTPQEFQSFYEGPITLKQAIIPPFKNKFETLCDNLDEEPREGWKMQTKYCHSYLWCGWSRIGGKTDDGGENTQLGQVFEFDEKSVNLFKYYGDVWVGSE